MENQYVDVPEIVAALDNALTRGVEVVLLLPAVSDASSSAAVTQERIASLQARAGLASHDNFTLCGIAGLGVDGRRKPVYVHSKLMLVDDEWATVGSCNLHHHSLFENGELNAAIGDREGVRAMRVELFQEHLATDTLEMDDASALLLYRGIACENRQRHKRNDPNGQGLVFSLDVSSDGHEPRF